MTVEIKLFQRLADGCQYARVRLRSLVRPGLISQNDVDRAGLAPFKFRVALAAAALAEHQCEKFGDKHDPDRIAYEAEDALRKAEMELGSRLPGIAGVAD